MRWRVAVALAVALPAVVVLSGTSGAAQRARVATPQVKVAPVDGTDSTHFVVSFRAPNAAGPYGGSFRRYSVAASGPRATGCASSGAGTVGSARQGELVRVTLAPRGHWCQGTYRGEVEELTTPLCLPVRACPAYTTVRRIGGFRFTVRRRA
jgi:hypothetical protein